MPISPDNQPRSFCGGIALPPRQVPHDDRRPTARETTIVDGIAGAVVGAYGAVRRAVATRGIS